MSYISNKFNISEGTVKDMMKDGLISCAWNGWEEIYMLRKQGKSMDEIAAITNRSKGSVSKVLKKFPK
jgi:hypothetical protein